MEAGENAWVTVSSAVYCHLAFLVFPWNLIESFLSTRNLIVPEKFNLAIMMMYRNRTWVCPGVVERSYIPQKSILLNTHPVTPTYLRGIDNTGVVRLVWR